MARNLAEAKDMLRIAERTTAVAMVNNQLRFLPARARVSELIRGGTSASRGLSDCPPLQPE